MNSSIDSDLECEFYEEPETQSPLQNKNLQDPQEEVHVPVEKIDMPLVDN